MDKPIITLAVTHQITTEFEYDGTRWQLPSYSISDMWNEQPCVDFEIDFRVLGTSRFLADPPKYRLDSEGNMTPEWREACEKGPFKYELKLQCDQINCHSCGTYHTHNCAVLTAYPVKEKAAAQLGRKGGLANSEAQNKARAANGKKGGRPKKVRDFTQEVQDEINEASTVKGSMFSNPEV